MPDRGQGQPGQPEGGHCRGGALPFAAVPEAAAAAGQLHVYLWLKQQGWPLGSPLVAAAGAGHRSVREELLADGRDSESAAAAAAAEAAARGGHVALMEWLMQEPHLEPTLEPFGDVVKGCGLVLVQRLYDSWRGMLQLSSEHWPGLLAAAADSPTIDWQAKVEWLEGEQPPSRHAPAGEMPGVCIAAASRPDAVDRLVWLRQRGYPVDVEAVVEAGCAGHDAAVRYLLEEAAVRYLLEETAVRYLLEETAVRYLLEEAAVRYLLEEAAVRYLLEEAAVHIEEDAREDRLMREAAKQGHLAVLQVLHSHDWDVCIPHTASWAAMGGHLAVVAWMADTFGVAAVPLGWGQFADAARSGNVQLLAWLRERGCDWSRQVFATAAESGCEEALEWLVEQGCPMPGSGWPYRMAARSGDEATLRCLRRLGCPWGAVGVVLTECVKFTHSPDLAGFVLPALRWLVEAGCPVHWERALQQATGVNPEAAARHGVSSTLVEVEAWLRSEKQQRSGSSSRDSGSKRRSKGREGGSRRQP